MRRETVMAVLADPLAQELLHSPLLARLGYNGPDGAPRVVPIGYLWNGSAFVVCTATMAPKVRALELNPKVALSMWTTPRAWWRAVSAMSRSGIGVRCHMP